MTRNREWGWRSRRAGAVFAAGVLAACAPAVQTPGGGTAPSPTATRATTDTTGLIPAGLGSLRQDDIAINVRHLGLSVRALPLDEDFIRTLAPDSYRAMVSLRESKRTQLDEIARRTGQSTLDVWYIRFFNVQQGEARFSPQELVITNQGRDYRALDYLPISSNFASQRLRQGESADALYVFDRALDPNQLLTMQIESQTGGDWRAVLQRVERERALIRSRAGGRGGVPGGVR